MAFLCDTLNVPNPTILTSSPLFRAFEIVSIIDSIHLVASVLESPADVEIAELILNKRE